MVRFKNRHLTVHVKHGGRETKAEEGQQEGFEIFRKTGLTVAILPESHESTGMDEIELKGNAFFEALVGSLQQFWGFGLAMNMTHLHCYKDHSRPHSTDYSEYIL